MADTMYKQDGTVVRCYDSDTLDYNNLSSQLKEKFSWFSDTEDFGLTDQYVHEYLNEPVIRSCVIPILANIYIDKLEQVDTKVANRLFCMESQTSVLYTTDIFTDSTMPSWVDQEMFIIAYTKAYEEYMRPCSEKLLNFTEYFFVAPDNVILNLGFEPEVENTVYSMIVSNNTIVAKRKYRELTTSGYRSVITPWQILYSVQARAYGRKDLIVDMYNKPYIV
jgi:hypothetical protein